MSSTEYEIRMHPVVEWVCPHCGKVNLAVLSDVEDYLEDSESDICEECYRDVKLYRGFDERKFFKPGGRIAVS